MAAKKWFKKKKYALRWYPSVWQGWLVLVVYILLIFQNILNVVKTSHSFGSSLTRSLVSILVLTVVLVVVCYLTGEKTEWSMGKNKKDMEIQSHDQKEGK